MLVPPLGPARPPQGSFPATCAHPLTPGVHVQILRVRTGPVSGQPVSRSGRQKARLGDANAYYRLGSTGTTGSNPLNQEPASWETHPSRTHPCARLFHSANQQGPTGDWVALPAGLAGSGGGGAFRCITCTPYTHTYTPLHIPTYFITAVNVPCSFG